MAAGGIRGSARAASSLYLPEGLSGRTIWKAERPCAPYGHQWTAGEPYCPFPLAKCFIADGKTRHYIVAVLVPMPDGSKVSVACNTSHSGGGERERLQKPSTAPREGGRDMIGVLRSGNIAARNTERLCAENVCGSMGGSLGDLLELSRWRCVEAAKSEGVLPGPSLVRWMWSCS